MGEVVVVWGRREEGGKRGETLLCDVNVSPLHANAHAPNSGGRSPGSQTPGDPATPSPP